MGSYAFSLFICHCLCVKVPTAPGNMCDEWHVNYTLPDSAPWDPTARAASASSPLLNSTPYSLFTPPIHTHLSPKPGIPPPKAYEPPEPPSVRDLGPPPPGYGRYADFDRSGNFPGQHPPGLGGSGGPPGPRRNLEDVVCYKVRPSLSCSCSTTFLSFVPALAMAPIVMRPARAG